MEQKEKKTINNNPENQKNNKKINSKLEISEYKKKISELEEEIKQQKSNFSSLEKKLNEDFVVLIKKKSFEAEKLLNQKEALLEIKYRKEFEEQKNFLYEKQLIELVNIFSEFEKIISYPVENELIKNYLFGFKMFLSKFENLFKKFGISKTCIKLGDDFNSDTMQAIETEKKELKKNKILFIFSNGFILNNRVIKLAEVKVGI